MSIITLHTCESEELWNTYDLVDVINDHTNFKLNLTKTHIFQLQLLYTAVIFIEQVKVAQQ